MEPQAVSVWTCFKVNIILLDIMDDYGLRPVIKDYFYFGIYMLINTNIFSLHFGGHEMILYGKWWRPVNHFEIVH